MRAVLCLEIDKQCSSCGWCVVSENDVDLECFKHNKIVEEEELCADWGVDEENIYENIEYLSPRIVSIQCKGENDE